MVPPPKKVFSDFLAGLPTGNVPTPAEPPAPDDLVSRAIQALARGSTRVAKGIQEAGTTQKDAWKKFLSNPTAENSVDIAGDLIAPMAGTTQKLFAAGAEEAPEFIKSLYSRLDAAIKGGPGKAPGKQWLSYLQKSAPKDEVYHTGLQEFLNNNLDNVVNRYQIQKAYNESPVRLNEVIYDLQKSPYGADGVPKFGGGFQYDIGTLQERVLQGELPQVGAIRENARILAEHDALTKQRQNTFRAWLDAGIDKSPNRLPDEEIKKLFDASTLSRQALEEFEAANPNINTLRLDRINGLREIPKHFYGTPNQIGWGSSVLGERNGKKALGLYEVQSDGAQSIRNVGRLNEVGGPIDSEVARLRKRLDDAITAFDKLHQTTGRINIEESFNLAKAKREAQEALDNYGVSRYSGGVLPLPFQKDGDWQELILKQALFRAAKEGADEIIIPSGKAVSKTIGLPKEGRKVYDRDLPNQLLDYLKKQLGYEAQPEQLMKPIDNIYPTINKVRNTLDPMMVGPNQWAIPDLPGPLPQNYRDVVSALEDASFRATPRNTSSLEPWLRNLGFDPVSINAVQSDAGIVAENLKKDPSKLFDGTAIPLTPEVRNKILEGQRLWALLAAAGIPTFMQMQQNTQPKKNDSKRSKPNGS